MLFRSMIDETLGEIERQVQYSRVAIKAIENLNTMQGQAYGQYCQQFYRFQSNRNRFTQYVYEQWTKLNDLDLRQFI